jgi:hypothetical protein
MFIVIPPLREFLSHDIEYTSVEWIKIVLFILSHQRVSSNAREAFLYNGIQNRFNRPQQ